jgi:hypothetical protein
MANGFTNAGEREVLRQTFTQGNIEMTLYNDATDQITDSDGVSEITEPQGSQFSRAVVSASDVAVTTDTGVAVVDIAAQFFNVTDSTMNVDGYALILPDGRLLHRGQIDTSDRSTDYIDLDQNDELLLGGEPARLDD